MKWFGTLQFDIRARPIPGTAPACSGEAILARKSPSSNIPKNIGSYHTRANLLVIPKRKKQGTEEERN
jgi:hypothetical protein